MSTTNCQVCKRPLGWSDLPPLCYDCRRTLLEKLRPMHRADANIPIGSRQAKNFSRWTNGHRGEERGG